MMPEISLNLLDVAQNGIKAGAKHLTLTVWQKTAENQLYTCVADDGCGMDEETVRRVTDPFFTTRTTRKVGLGIPFFKQAAELTGGRFLLESTPGRGTKVTAVFVLDSIDRMPLGDMNATVLSLIQCNPALELTYTYGVDDRSFDLSTEKLREMLGDVPLNTPEIMSFLSEYLGEQTQLIKKGAEES